jgi:predicted nucleic acid-binding protein
LITAVDSSVIIDLLNEDPEFFDPSARAFSRCIQQGRVVACEIVLSEVTAFAADSQGVRDALARLQVVFSPMSEAAALSAGDAWGAYRRRGGIRSRIVADFLVGAHALHHAERLLTRDRGFYRRFFEGLQVLDPTE